MGLLSFKSFKAQRKDGTGKCGVRREEAWGLGLDVGSVGDETDVLLCGQHHAQVAHGYNRGRTTTAAFYGRDELRIHILPAKGP